MLLICRFNMLSRNALDKGPEWTSDVRAIGGTWAWWSYDAVAETFDRLAVPHVFTQPAKDLVATLRLPPGARVLDVGTGTGVAALLALQYVGMGALVHTKVLQISG